MRFEIKVELDGSWDAKADMPEDVEFVSFNVAERGMDFITAGWLILNIVQYGSAGWTAYKFSQKIYEYFKNRKNVKSIEINGKKVDQNNKKEIKEALKEIKL